MLIGDRDGGPSKLSLNNEELAASAKGAAYTSLGQRPRRKETVF